MTAITAEQYRQLFQQFPGRMCVVAAASRQGAIAAMTCSSLTSVSDDPPTLLISLKRGCATTEAISQSATFAVYVPADSIRQLDDQLATNDDSPHLQLGMFSDEPWAAAQNETCTDGQAYGAAHCSVVRSMDIGTHRIVVGRIKHLALPSPSLTEGSNAELRNVQLNHPERGDHCPLT